ncbi:MAG TPA: hypothetical protein VLA97_10100 [Nocardioidaceae bacterium]|nr:hypothetical protein [Nocardioidaceae bacterium]
MNRTSTPLRVAAAGCALAVALMLADTLAGGSDLRSGLVPLSLAVVCLAGAVTVWTVAACELGVPRRLAAACARLVAVALVWVAGFFLSLAVLAMLGSDLLSADTDLTSFGTLLTSVVTLVVVPVGLLVLGVCLLRDRRLPLTLRLEPWLLMVLLAGGVAVLGALPEGREVGARLGLVTALAGVVAHLGSGIRRHSVIVSEPNAPGQPSPSTNP